MTARLAPTHGALRAVRGGLLAVTSGGLAVTAHALGGGHPPDTAVAVVLTLLLAGAGTALADRRRGAPAILTALGGSQLALHLLLGALSTHSHSASAPTVDPTTMTAAHAVAALGTGILLTGAESAVFALAGALAMVLPKRLTPPPAFAPLRAAVPSRESVRPVQDVLFRRVLTGRGPPVPA